MKKVTLGGERLGSGKKMDVEMHGFERSTHDLSYIWRSTMAAGTLVPFMSEVALPGDTFDIDLNCEIMTHPTVGPLFGSYKVQLDVFSCPVRLYHSALHNNMLGIGMNMSAIKLPKIELLGSELDPNNPDFDNAQINSSSLLSYLGLRGVGTVPNSFSNNTRKFNAVPLLAYWEIYKQYYSNKQEEEGAYICQDFEIEGLPWTLTIVGQSIPNVQTVLPVNVAFQGTFELLYTGVTPPDLDTVVLIVPDGRRLALADLVTDVFVDTASNTIGGVWDWNRHKVNLVSWFTNLSPTEQIASPVQIKRFPLANIDDMRIAILQQPPFTQFEVNGIDLLPYTDVWKTIEIETGVFYPLMRGTQHCLGLKTYQSDLFNNWLSTEWIDGTGGINEITAIDTSGGSFNIDTLNLSKKVYEMLNRIAVSGGSYDDWLSAVYDHDAFGRAESPVYLGGLIKELVFQEVVSNAVANGDGGEQPLGTLAGKGRMGDKHKGGKISARIDEPSYIIGIVSLTPRIDYSQGNKWDVNLDTLDDLHKPSLDEIGFQELITEQMAWWSTTKLADVPDVWVTRSAGKQPAWINYMTNVNQVRGNFAIRDNEMFMTLNRRYEPQELTNQNFVIDDLTTYIDPSKFNNVFAQTSLDSQNFWTQISCDVIARRKMSAKVMPNL